MTSGIMSESPGQNIVSYENLISGEALNFNKNVKFCRGDFENSFEQSDNDGLKFTGLHIYY